jgi:hypothetical protein
MRPLEHLIVDNSDITDRGPTKAHGGNTKKVITDHKVTGKWMKQ